MSRIRQCTLLRYLPIADGATARLQRIGYSLVSDNGPYLFLVFVFL